MSVSETTPKAKPSKKRNSSRDSHSRRDEVLDVALRIFAAQGYRATTMEDIATALDFTPAALYYYFRSKQAILMDIVARPINAMMAEADRIEGTDASSVDKLRDAIDSHVRLITERQEWFIVMLREQVELPAEQLASVNEKNRAYRLFLTGLIDSAVRSGELRSSHASVVALVVIGAINWTMQWWRDDGVMEPVEIAHVLTSMVLDGLRPRADG